MYAKTLALVLSFCGLVSAQNYRVSTIAGFGTYGGDGGAAIAALVNPNAVAVAPNGTLYLGDPSNHRIRKIDPFGTITTIAGTGSAQFEGDGVLATTAPIAGAYSLALDGAGNLYFTDEGNLRVREVTTTGIIKTVAGNGSCGTVTAGMAAMTAPLCDVEAVAVDTQGRVYFGSESQVWMVNPDGTLTLVAGTGVYGNSGDGGAASAAQLSYLSSLAVDATGNLYIADYYNLLIRKVGTDKRISTVATITDHNSTALALALDASGSLYYATGITSVYKLGAGGSQVVGTVTTPQNAACLGVDSTGAFYVCSINTQQLIKIANGSANPIAGAYPYGPDNLSTAANVRLHLNPLLIGLAVDSSNNVYFPELAGDLKQRIDKVSPGGAITALSAPAKLPTNGDFTVQAVTIGPGGAVYFSTFTQVYRLETFGVTLIAGAPGFPSALGDGGLATAARISNPSSIVFDQTGNLYITEPFDNRVRKVNTQGIISTFAGTSQAGYTGDGGPASSAKLSTPVDVKVDGQGNIYIADLTAHVVRKVNSSGTITTVAGKLGAGGFSGDGGQATQAELSGAAAIAIDPAGNLFIADRPSAASTISPATDNNRIRMVTPAGIISTIAGPTHGYNGENVQAQAASLGGPVALAADAQGNIYVNESDTQRIRKLTPIPGELTVVISSVHTAFGNAEISQNAWIAIKGTNLAPASVGTGIVWDTNPDFLAGRLPTQLGGVSVMINNKPAFIYFASPGQINALCPIDATTGDVSIVVTNSGVSSVPFTVKEKAATPSFLRFGATSYIAATHGDSIASLLGPVSLSVPGVPFAPAKPGEIIVLYGVGGGLLASALTNGSGSQYGLLAPQPQVLFDGVSATVEYGGINGPPGLYQYNVHVPQGTRDGEVEVVVKIGDTVTPVSTVTIHH